MTNREKEILDLIRKDPMISQQEVADLLGIARASVAVHITNLMKKGLIRGKGYVLAEEDRVIVIGGATMDIFGFPTGELKPGISNPGSISASCGGVGRNIAENLAKLGASVSLVTAIGKDSHGNQIAETCQNAGIDMSKTCISSKYRTSTYLSIQTRGGDMAWAVSQMETVEELSVQYLRQLESWLEQGAQLVLDANLSGTSLEWLCQTFKNKKIWFDPVSTEKASKILPVLGCLTVIKPNRLEAEILTGIKADSREGILENWKYFIEKGIQEVWLSLGAEGLFYGNREKGFFARTETVESQNANGAGDAMMAAAIKTDGVLEIPEERVRYALATAMATCTARETIHPDLSEGLVKKYIKEVYIDECIFRL